MSPASDPPAESLPPESSGVPIDGKTGPETLPDMLPERRVARAALPPALPAAGTPGPNTPGQNLPVPVAPAGPLMPQWPASPMSAPAWREGRSGERTDDYPYGPGTSRVPGNAGSFGGGAYHGPTGDGYSHDYAESTYAEPLRDEPRYEEPRRAPGNSGPQEANSWFTTPDLPKLDYQDQGFQAPRRWQGGYQGEGFAPQQPAPPPVPPDVQGYPGQSTAGYPGPAGGYSAQAASQFGNGYPGPGRPAADFPPPAGFPPPPAGPPSAPPGGFPPPGGFQSPPAGSPFPAPGFPSPPRPGEFQGFQPPGIPGGQFPGFGGQQAEGFQPTAAFAGPQPGQPPFPGPQPGQPPFAGPQFGQLPYGGPAAPPVTAAMPWYQRIGGGKPRLLIGGAVAVVVVVGGVALAVPKLLGSSDPGCALYTGTALTAYNQTINDLNAQASQSQLTSDMTSAIADLTTAADQANSATVKSALDGLLGELSTVRADVQKGSVPAETVAALNTASRAADNAC
jgi:hypothetical protein